MDGAVVFLSRFAPAKVAVIGIAMGCAFASSNAVAASAAVPNRETTATLRGTASLSGTVDTPKPFKAAQVYIRNVDKRILYMVYTDKGAFRAVALFPGHYEVDVQSIGLESGVEQVFLGTGDHPHLLLHMHDAPAHLPSASPDISSPPAHPNEEEFPRVAIRSYEQIYPPGPGRVVVEKQCMVCHFEDFLPSRPHSMRTEAAWKRETMQWPDGCLSGSALAPPAAMFVLTKRERQEVFSYLVQNLGPDKPPRAVRTTQPVPLDEAALGKAEFIEYYLTGNSEPVPPGGASDESADNLAHYRTLFTLALANDGNVWGVDHSVPNRLVELDPRTGIQKSFVMPDPLAGNHEILIDRSGLIWAPEFDGVPEIRNYRLRVFDPETERWKLIDADPNHILKGFRIGILGIGLDSKDNIYMNWIGNGYVSRWQRSTGKISFYRVPTPLAQPYGLTVDRNDNVFVALYLDGKLAKLDATSKEWTLYAPPTYPAYVRRGVGGEAVDSHNDVWFGVYAAGKRPGTLNMLDQVTGRITQWTIPYQDAEPYGVSVGPQDMIWFPSQGTPDHPAVLGRFDPRTQKFTFYPKPQFIAESPKVEIATDGSVWYAPRFGAPAGYTGFGVLYPDKDKLSSLAAYPMNGAPGYVYKVAASRPEGH